MPCDSINHEQCNFQDREFSYREYWKTFDLWMVGICLTLGFLMICRSAGLLFQGDDLRYLWWCQDRLHQPWMIFTDPPIFGDYFRPVIALLWWLHYILFGMNEFFHQLALSLWWLSIALLLYRINRIQLTSLAGFFACLVFFSLYAPGYLLLWKSWLTSIVSIVFQLAALSSLSVYLQKENRFSLFSYFAFFLLACFSKESAVVCLPCTSAALILISPLSIEKKIGFFLFLFVFLDGYFYHFPMWQSGSLNWKNQHIQIPLYTERLATFSLYVLGNTPFKIFLAILIGFSYFEKGKILIACKLLVGIAAGFIGWIAWKNHIPTDQCVSFILLVLTHSFVFSSRWRVLIIPTIWFMTAFWPFSILPSFMPGYAADASIALSWLMSCSLYIQLERIMSQSWQTYRIYKNLAWKNICYPLLGVGIGGFFIISVYGGIKTFFGLHDYVVQINNKPMKESIDRILGDLIGIRSWGVIYIDPANRLEEEAYAGLILLNRFHFQVLPPPQNGIPIYRLEAYTRQNYQMQPDDDPLNIWLPQEVGPPSPLSKEDPYYIPENWIIQRITDCDTTGGWIPQEQYSREVFPYGQDFSFVQHPLIWSPEPQEFHFQSNVDALYQTSPESFVLTFWLETPRWEMIDRISLQVTLFSKQYTWDQIQPTVLNTNSSWRRVIVHESKASSKVEEMVSPSPLDFRLHIQTRQGNDTVGSRLGIDEIRIAKRKPIAPIP